MAMIKERIVSFVFDFIIMVLRCQYNINHLQPLFLIV